MNFELQQALRASARSRAHEYGAQAVILEKEAAALLTQAAEAKRRYFRELEAVDLLGGHTSVFGALG